MKINNITGGYPGKFMMKDISFNIEKGKIYALLGLNGSGKSTIIKMICGTLKPQFGNIYVDDKDILNLKEKERAKIVSYVPQKSNIVYDISVLDVVLMGVTPYLNTFQMPDKNHISMAYSFLEKLGIEEFAKKNYITLSEGQKQIVIIARAMLQNGDYMILDEPDSSLDLVNKHKLMKKIRQVDNNKGCLISMHDPEYALNYCDKILLVNDGKVSEIDINDDNILLLENKLSSIYGHVKILRYNSKYILFYDE